MAEFITAIADDLVSGGIGELVSTSGVSIHQNVRRDVGAPHYVTLKQTGGLAFAHKGKEQYALQVMIDSNDPVSGQTIARDVYDRLHERISVTLGGHDVLWIRAIAPPQAVPMGPSAGQPPERFQFSVNFDSLIRKDGGT